MRTTKIVWALCSVALLAGCGGGSSDEGVSAAAPAPTPAATSGLASGVPADLKISADAGISVPPVDAATGQKEATDEALARRVTPRRDPFALFAGEIANERRERAAKLLDESGGFSTMFSLPEEAPIEEEQVVPAPPGLRLVGVIISNGVSGLLEIGGRAVDVRPGTALQAGEDTWIVVSLDEEKAVLRRPGNKRPKEIIVPLSSRLDPMLTGGAGGGGGGASSPSQGAPGGGGERDSRGGGRPGEDF